jgi:hypothetical protein
MGDVIAFRPQANSGRGRRPDGCAQILFFTGVRYHRDDAAERPSRSRPSPPKKRGAGRSLGGGKRRRKT